MGAKRAFSTAGRNSERVAPTTKQIIRPKRSLQTYMTKETAMFKKFMTLSLILLLATFVTACKPNRPKGCPKLYPCTIKVIQGGEPLEGAVVNLYPNDVDLSKWPMCGLTDANGQIKIMTQTFYGVPLGSYTVTVSKAEETHTLPPVVMQHVEEQYTLKDLTPLKIEVTKKNSDPYTLDVGDPL